MITPRLLGTGVVLLAVLGACAPPIDLEAERASLRATDEAWAAAASEGADVELIASFWSDDATVYPEGSPLVQGKDAIIEMVRSSLELPGFHVTWQPETVVVAAAGDMGWTAGSNEFTVPDSADGTRTIRGHYVTIWRKEADGTWKCVIDMTNTRGAPQS